MSANIGMLIKEKRLSLKLSFNGLAKLCNVSNSEINKIENGSRKRPGWQNLCQIANALDLSPLEILREAGYITENDINPLCRLHGVNQLDAEDLEQLQTFIDFLIFQKKMKGNGENNDL